MKSKHKEKKSKKSKRSKDENQSEDEWIEKPTQVQAAVHQDWMNGSEDMFSGFGIVKKKRNADELQDDDLTPKELEERKKKVLGPRWLRHHRT